MALTVSFSLDVTPLPDNEVWFANSAAWTNYWRNLTISAELDSAANAIYVEVPYNSLLGYFTLNYLGVDYALATQEQFTSLLSSFNTLNASYKQLRDDLKNAGFILNSQ